MWILVGVTVWTLAAIALAVVIAGAIRQAEREAHGDSDQDQHPGDDGFDFDQDWSYWSDQ